MNKEKKIRLEAAGINVEGALERFMGNEAMFERYLKKFPAEKSYVELKEALAADDREAARIAAHTLKSVCGTLGCDDMYALVLRQEQYLRGENWDAARGLMPDIVNSYEKACSVLREQA